MGLEESMENNRTDIEKKRYWQKVIREATRSKLSIREYCRQNQLRESQYYWWQNKLNGSRRPKRLQKQARKENPATFALVSNDSGAADAGIELILQDGRRLRNQLRLLPNSNPKLFFYSQMWGG
jgi:hypothetical protein